MRNLFAVIAVLAVGITAFASLKGSPYQPHDDKRFNDIESMADGALELPSAEIIVGDSSGNGNPVALSGDATISNAGALTIAAGSVEESMLAVPTADSNNALRVARATFDCGTDDCSVGTLVSTITLPAKAMLLQSWFRVATQFVDGGSGTVAISCEDANNLYTATDITAQAVGTITAGAIDGTDAGDFLDVIASDCVVTMTIATAEQTAGVMNFFVMYVVHD